MLQPLRIIKNWLTNTKTREQNWDEIADNITGYATRTNNNLKQLALDIGGSRYDFNNNGVGTQTTDVITRLTTLETSLDLVGTRNLGLDLSTPSIVKLVSSDGTDLSSTNKGYVAINSTSNAGQIVTYEISANILITLTGAHWGFDTYGDLTDQPLYVYLLDTGSAIVMGIAADAGRRSILSTDGTTAVGSVTTFEKVLVSTALSATVNGLVFANLLADFDDTGNGGGENFWTVQTGVGEVDIGPHPVLSELYF